MALVYLQTSEILAERAIDFPDRLFISSFGLEEKKIYYGYGGQDGLHVLLLGIAAKQQPSD